MDQVDIVMVWKLGLGEFADGSILRRLLGTRVVCFSARRGREILRFIMEQGYNVGL